MANKPGSDAAILAAVGPRLRELRQRHGVTLTQVAGSTGISISTLSRLESGDRRPTLELLLPLASTYQVSLDNLVGLAGAAGAAGADGTDGTDGADGAPATDDPRIRPRPIVRHATTFVPLTRRAGGIRAYKQILRPTPPERQPEQRTHQGYEWLYVLSGKVRLLLGDHDLALGPGEAAEFDTRLPHNVSNPGPTVAELLTLFGPQGERVHVRARSTRGERT